MADQNLKADFQFVVATITNPRAPEDKAVRTLIRKQAMKQASEARRRLGTYGKHNLRQYPVFSKGSPTEVTKSDREDTDQGSYSDMEYSGHGEADRTLETKPFWSMLKTLPTQDRLFSIPSSISPRDYQALLVSYNFDIFDLSSLASLHIGRFAGRALLADPTQLARLLRSRKWSYLTYLPTLYGRISCLNDAVDCIIARVRQIFVSNGRNLQSMVIPLYVKALKSLQKALDDPRECFRPEVLCSIEILALYELLNPSSKNAWVHHAAGAARVIQIRGPRNYRSDFEKALLMAHANPIMTESLLNNKRCFLESSPWRDLFLSLIIEDHEFSDWSKISISLLVLKSRVPGVFSDIASVTCNRNTAEDFEFRKAALGVRQLRTELLHWFYIYGSAVTLSPGQPTNTIEYDQRSEIRSTYLSCMMITTRLLAVSSTPERAILEDEAQEYANQVVQLEHEIRHLSQHAAFYLVQTLVMARSIKSTYGDWNDAYQLGDVDSIIDKGKFERWTSSFGCIPL